MPPHAFYKVALCFLIGLLFPMSVYGAEAPHEIAGIRLGGDITDYPHLEYSNYLKEIVVTNWGGFAKGMISYGICDSPGKVVKMKFKYDDTSEKFYKDMLKDYKKKFGKPGKWEGDAFGIQHVWKWSFTDKNNNRIEMILQHNLRAPKAPIGTVVTLSFPDQIAKEKECFDKTCKANMENADYSKCKPNCPMRVKTGDSRFWLPK